MRKQVYSRPDGLRRSQDVTTASGKQREPSVNGGRLGLGGRLARDSCRALQAGFGSGDSTLRAMESHRIV